MSKLSDCLKTVRAMSDMPDSVAEDLLATIDEYRADGLPERKATLMALADSLKSSKDAAAAIEKAARKMYPAPKAAPKLKTGPSILGRIRQMGGLQAGDAMDITGDTAGRANKRMPGLFKREGGRSLDDLAGVLRDDGYSIPDGTDGGVQALKDMIRDDLNGSRTLRPEDQMRAASNEQEARNAEAAGRPNETAPEPKQFDEGDVAKETAEFDALMARMEASDGKRNPTEEEVFGALARDEGLPDNKATADQIDLVAQALDVNPDAAERALRAYANGGNPRELDIRLKRIADGLDAGRSGEGDDGRDNPRGPKVEFVQGKGPRDGAEREGVPAGGRERGRGRRGDRAGDGGGDGFELKSETAEEVRAKEAARKKAADEEAAKANAPSEKEFELAGSDRPADANRNQADLLDEEPPKKSTPKEKALDEVYELGLDPELTKARVRATAKRFLKSGLIDEGDYREIDRMLKDRDMAAEDAAGELGSAVRYSKGSGAGTLAMNPFANPAAWKDMLATLKAMGVRVKDFMTFNDAMSEDAFDAGGVPNETVRDMLIRRIQNKYHFVGLLQKQIELAGKKIDELSDTVLATTLFPGRAGSRVRSFEDGFVRPLQTAIRQVAKNKSLTMDDIGNYLYAKHAPERNATIAARNPKLRDGGSGMTNAEAAKIIADFRASGKIAALERIAKLVYAIGAEKKRVVGDAKLLPDAVMKTWNKWQFYVPLKGEELEDSGGGAGAGFSVRGLGEKGATGRFSKAADIMENMIVDAELAIIRAEKARVGRTFLRMVEDNPNPKLWSVDKPPSRALVGADGVVRYVPDGLAQLDRKQSVVVTDATGEVRIVNLKGEAGELIARAINNTGPEQMGTVVRLLNRYSRFFASLQTKYSPQFTMTNLLRDVQTALVNAGVDYDGKLAAKMLSDLAPSGKVFPSATRAIWRDARRSTKRVDEWDDWVKRFRQAGGETHFINGGDLEMKRDLLARAYKEGDGSLFSVSRKSAEEVLDFIGDANTAGENTLRLVVFRRLVERGLSEDKAADTAKNLTVNFNRHGELGPWINSLYVFFNAGVQGTARLLKAGMTKKGASIIIGGGAAAGYALAAMNRQQSDYDEDGVSYYDKIPDDVKNKWMLMMAPADMNIGPIKLRAGRDYIKLLPIPFGYGMGVNVGSALNDAITAPSRNSDPWAAAARVVDAGVNSFNPLGQTSLFSALQSGDPRETAGELAKLLSPTITDPAVELATNRDWQGNRIMKEQPPFGRQKPRSAVAQSQTSDTAKTFAAWANEATGGDAFSPGKMDLSPDMLDYIVRQYTGGAGRFWFNLGQSTMDVARGKEPDAKRIPFASLAFGQTSARPYSEYRRAINEIEQDEARFKETGDSRGDMYQLAGEKRAVEKFVKSAMERKRGMDDKEAQKELEEQIESRMKGLLNSYYETGGKQSASQAR